MSLTDASGLLQILKRSGLQGTTVRLGQISGGEPIGAWSPNDWLPILVKSSVTLKGLPSLPGVCFDQIFCTIVDSLTLKLLGMLLGANSLCDGSCIRYNIGT